MQSLKEVTPMIDRDHVGFLAVLLFLFAAGTIADAQEKPKSPIEQGINLLDAGGKIHSLQPQAGEAARAFVFITGECPISKAYIPELNRLAEAWSKGDAVLLYGIWADPTQSSAQVAQFAREYEIRFPILVDREGELARRFQPTHIPETFVLDTEGTLAYRGRIDDTFPEIGRRRPEATEHNLADAVNALVTKKSVAVARTEPVGCLFEGPSTSQTRSAEEPVNYTRDVAPILFANCVFCHREGEVGPFSLLTYQDAAKRAKQIAIVTERRLMPPWMPAETHGEFEGQRSLTSRQIETLRLWGAGERPEGNPADLPPAPQFVPGWRLGKPDLVLEMSQEFVIPADGPDIFQNFVIPIDIPANKLVAASDFIPGNPRVVHHSLFFLDANHVGRKLDAKTPEPGYHSFGDPGFMPTGSLGGWSLGKTPRRLPNGLGRDLRKGSDLVMQVHYHPSGKRETDRSKVAIYFVDRPKNVAADIWASAFTHDIPPGEKNYRMKAVYVLPNEVTMLGVVPHMHLLGRSMKAVARLPDGTERSLIDVPHWNFNWQDDYRFARPFKLPKGSRLEVEAVYDNSSDNPSNPSHPPKRVTWGEETTDEMLYCFFFVATESPRQLMPILGDVLMHEVMGKNLVLRKK